MADIGIDNKDLELFIEKYAPIRKSLVKKFSFFDSEDLDQDLILVMLEAIKDYRKEDSNFPYFLKKRCLWYCLDLAKKKRPDFSLNSLDDNGVEFLDSLSDGLPLEEVFCEDLDKKSLLSLVAGLPKRERFVVFNYYYRRKNLREIANIMKLSLASVSRIHKSGLKLLKKLLVTSGFFDGPC